MIQLPQGDNDLRRALTWNEGKGQPIRSNFNDPAKKTYYLFFLLFTNFTEVSFALPILTIKPISKTITRNTS